MCLNQSNKISRKPITESLKDKYFSTFLYYGRPKSRIKSYFRVHVQKTKGKSKETYHRKANSSSSSIAMMLLRVRACANPLHSPLANQVEIEFAFDVSICTVRRTNRRCIHFLHLQLAKQIRNFTKVVKIFVSPNMSTAKYMCLSTVEVYL